MDDVCEYFGGYGTMLSLFDISADVIGVADANPQPDLIGNLMTCLKKIFLLCLIPNLSRQCARSSPAEPGLKCAAWIWN